MTIERLGSPILQVPQEKNQHGVCRSRDRRRFQRNGHYSRWTMHHLMLHEAEHRGQIIAIQESYQYQNHDG